MIFSSKKTSKQKSNENENLHTTVWRDSHFVDFEYCDGNENAKNFNNFEYLEDENLIFESEPEPGQTTEANPAEEMDELNICTVM